MAKPRTIGAWIAAGLFAARLALPIPAAGAEPADFAAFLASLWPEAQALGVSRGTFDGAVAGLAPDLTLPELVVPGRAPRAERGQAEFVQTPASYVSEPAIARLAARGRRLAEKYRPVLAAIARQTGVPPAVLLAIWGRETDFGAARLPYDAVRVLATEAWIGRRRERFRPEFLLALKMLQDGRASRAEMRSSWAGAMGQTQFLPSDFLRDAVDFDGDGRADIWRSVPDALASTARQLIDKGWQPGEAWAFEVRLPPGFDCSEADPDVVRPVGAWLDRGLVAAHPLDAAAQAVPASLFLPAGTHGPAFLTPKNFYVFKAYNFSDLYALFVGHLADRIAGGGGFAQPWGPVAKLAAADLAVIQRRLTGLGLYRGAIDGKAGQKTMAAIGAFEKKAAMPLDCWPSAAVLARLRGG